MHTHTSQDAQGVRRRCGRRRAQAGRSQAGARRAHGGGAEGGRTVGVRHSVGAADTRHAGDWVPCAPVVVREPARAAAGQFLFDIRLDDLLAGLGVRAVAGFGELRLQERREDGLTAPALPRRLCAPPASSSAVRPDRGPTALCALPWRGCAACHTAPTSRKHAAAALAPTRSATRRASGLAGIVPALARHPSTQLEHSVHLRLT